MPVRPTALARLPHDIDLVLAVAMAKDPRDRFATPAAFTTALGAALRADLDDATRQQGQRLVAVMPWAEPDRR